MSALSQALKLSLLLLLMQCILSESVLEQSKQPLEKLNDIVTKRIHSTLKEHQDSPTKSQDEEFQRQFQRLSLAAALPLDKLDEKIRAYHAYRNYGEKKQSNSNADQSLIRQANESENYTAFEKRVISLLEKLGVYDRYTERVFRAIFSDDKLLKALKKRLDELDKDKDDSNKNKNKNKDKDFDCCLWDFIHSLF
ncbi:uncharacterized protein LOC132796635 [Drosophila nasuta]|uniref:uncharacterized protein LOC132796635 n=1 Tax=Drosophila nasuta TaxID=42062 RepID=UPI00295E5F2D|nr:uncharacterized protein LOC132796635 [Drosophila nasuta]